MNATVRVPLPWSRRHRLLLVAFNLMGALLIGVAWFWAAGRAEAQTASLNLAVGAMVLAGGANGLWLMRGRRAIGRRRRAWLADLRAGAPGAARPEPLA
jgi:hypothetical protein